VWYRLGERPASIDLRILDVRGRALRVLDRGERGPGDHWIQWNGTDAHGQRLASGVYFVRLSYGGLARAEKCVLMR
jgi:flagellar hook assembly protein FlgD